MAISWTKAWTSADDGTVVSGSDLKNLQDDIDGGLTSNATNIQGVPVDAPVPGDDGSLLFYDNSNAKFDYVTRLAVLATAAATVDINAGTLDGVTIGATVAPTVTDIDINGGTLDGVTVDGATLTGMLYTNDASDDLSQLGSQGTLGQTLTSAGAGANPTWSSVTDKSEFFSADGTFTVPTGVTKVYLTMIGGGGGGASGGAQNTENGGGGGSGAWLINYPYTVTPAAGLAVVIGTGGAGGVYDANNVVAGVDGVATTFNTVVSCAGGNLALAAGNGENGVGGAASGGYDGAASVAGGYTGVSGAGGNGTNSVGGGSGGSPFGVGVTGGAGSGGIGTANTGVGGAGGAGAAGANGGAGGTGFVLVQW